MNRKAVLLFRISEIDTAQNVSMPLERAALFWVVSGENSQKQ